MHLEKHADLATTRDEGLYYQKRNTKPQPHQQAKHTELCEKEITSALKVLLQRGVVCAPRGASRWYTRCVDEDDDMATSAVRGLQRLRVGGAPTPTLQPNGRRVPLTGLCGWEMYFCGTQTLLLFPLTRRSNQHSQQH